MQRDFDTTTRRNRRQENGTAKGPLDFLVRNRAQVIVALLVVVALFGGALYSSRVSEKAPKVVYTAALSDVAQKAQTPLKVNINEADEEQLDELPEVGPATAREIVEFRQANGPFSSVEELEKIPGIGPTTIKRIEPFATV